MEVRFQSHDFIEERSGDAPVFTGIIRFWDGTPGTEYVLKDTPGDKRVERIMPTAFDASLASNDEIWAYYNHDSDRPLAVRSGSLALAKEAGGLRYRFPFTDHPLHELVRADLKLRLLKGSSFGFHVTEEKWRAEGSFHVREIHGVKLIEVSPVRSPAYSSSTIGLRSNASTQDAEASWRAYQTKIRFERHR